MDVKTELLSLLDEALHLEGRSSSFDEHTPLLGALPELDSMGVVALLTAFEDRLGFAVDDDEIDGSVFQTFGTLLGFVRSKMGT
jgi:acyl carrier protein